MNLNTFEQIYLKLLKANYLLNENVSKIAKHHDLNSSELMIYLDIKTHPNTDLNALCQRLGMKKSAASKAIDKLIKNHYLESKSNKDDNRKLALNIIALADQNLCQEVMLKETFRGYETTACDLNKIEAALDETIKLLSVK